MFGSNNNFSVAMIALIITVITWGASSLGLFGLLDGLAYDQCVRFAPKPAASSTLLVVEVETERGEVIDENWSDILQTLLALGARRVVFGFFPDGASERFYRQAAASGKTIFARRIVMDRNGGETNRLEPLPEGIGGISLRYGVIALPPAPYGVYRMQYAAVTLADRTFPTIERLAARRLLSDLTQLSEAPYRVNFIGGSGRIPRVTLKRIVSDGFVPELIEGRTILIGRSEGPEHTGYFTPLSYTDGLTPELLFHAFAMDTLTSNRQIAEPGSGVVFFIVLGVVALNLVVYQALSYRPFFWISLTLLVVYTLIAWSGLNLLRVWSPYVEMLSAQLLTFFVLTHHKAFREERDLLTIGSAVSAELREKVAPVGFLSTGTPWDQIAALVDQTLDLTRSVFLERSEKDDRFQEVKMLNCSVDDIDERRRDSQRPPYRTAVSEKEPIRVDKPFFKTNGQEEQHYLAQLAFAGEVLGFWAFGVAPDHVQSRPRFMKVIQDFSEQIGEMLYHQRRRERTGARKENRRAYALRFEGGDSVGRSLQQGTSLLSARLRQLQAVFDGLNSCSVLYDLFGRVVLINQRMEALARSANLKPFAMTTLDLIVAITGYERTNCRKLLLHAVFDHERLSVPIPSFVDGNSYMLHLTSLQSADLDGVSDDAGEYEIAPFHGRRILCELVDITNIKQICDLKTDVLQRVYFQLRNDLASLLYALSLLEVEHLPQEKKNRVIQAMHQKIDGIIALQEQVQSLDVRVNDLRIDALECYPVDGRLMLLETVAEVGKQALNQGIRVEKRLPELMNLVLASPDQLRNIIRDVLTFLVADTFEDGNVVAEVEETTEHALFRFSNQGFGLPDERLRDYLNDEEALVSDDMKRLRRAVECVERWGGTMQITSTLGEGFMVVMALKTFA
jgi:CHASE2 domain-containing sensor protein